MIHFIFMCHDSCVESSRCAASSSSRDLYVFCGETDARDVTNADFRSIFVWLRISSRRRLD